MAINKLSNWAASASLVVNYDETKSSLNTLIIISVALMALDIILSNFSEIIMSNIFTSWCDMNKKNLAYSIRAYLIDSEFASKTKEKLGHEKEVINKCINCEMLKDVIYKEKCKNREILSSIITVISSILLVVFLIGAVEDVMQRILLDINAYKNGLTIKSLEWIKEWWAIIIAILLSAIDTIFIRPKQKGKQSLKNQFVKDNIPEGYENYIKYFASK